MRRASGSARLERCLRAGIDTALTNTVKHAHATRAEVRAVVADGALHVEVRDDGIGGARAETSTGLLGLQDRVAAMNGELIVKRPSGGGTTVVATLPVPRPRPEEARPSTPAAKRGARARRLDRTPQGVGNST